MLKMLHKIILINKYYIKEAELLNRWIAGNIQFNYLKTVNANRGINTATLILNDCVSIFMETLLYTEGKIDNNIIHINIHYSFQGRKWTSWYEKNHICCSARWSL